MPVTPSPPGSSQSSSKHKDVKQKKKKSWSLEGKKKGTKKSRAQIKEMLLGKERIKEEDLDAPPNSDAKDESLRILDQQMCMPEKEEYVSKQPKIAVRRKKVKKKGTRRAETLRPLKKRGSRALSKEEQSGSADTSLFKERASANNSNANSPDNSERLRERERLKARLARKREECTQQDLDQSTITETGTVSAAREGDSIPLALEPDQQTPPPVRSVPSKRTPIEKAPSSRPMNKSMLQQLPPQIESNSPSETATLRSSLSSTRTSKSIMGMPPQPKQRPPPTNTTSGKEESQSTQLALEPEPDLDRVRRQKEAAFMKRFLTALKFLPKNPPRPAPPAAPRSEDSPSDSSKRHPRNFKPHPHQRKK